MKKFISAITVFIVSVLLVASCIDLDDVEEVVDELNWFADGDYNGAVSLSGDYDGDYDMYFRAFIGDSFDDEFTEEDLYVMRIIGRDDTGEFGLRQFELYLDIIEAEEIVSNFEEAVYPLQQVIEVDQDGGVYGASFHWHTSGLNYVEYWRDVEGELRITEVTADSVWAEFEFTVFRSPGSDEYVEVTNGSFALDLVNDIIPAN